MVVYVGATQTLDLVWSLSDIANALMAVSYTHLDVYKRQITTCENVKTSIISEKQQIKRFTQPLFTACELSLIHI